MKDIKVPGWIHPAGFAVGLGMLYAVAEWDWDFLISPMMAVFGTVLGLRGLEAILTRRASEGGTYAQYSKYTGTAAIAFGLTYLLLGLFFFFGALVNLLGYWDPLWSYLKTHPGWLTGGIGLFLLLGSIQGLLGRKEEKRWAGMFVRSLLRQLISVIGIILSLLLIAISGLALVWPAGFEAIVKLIK
ncbi:MAG TPA: hypothetical protein VJ965_04485 [Anaerolineales bacterium]|nr:hypothetical protein [Anaerolineales bacterium]